MNPCYYSAKPTERFRQNTEYQTHPNTVFSHYEPHWSENWKWTFKTIERNGTKTTTTLDDTYTCTQKLTLHTCSICYMVFNPLTSHHIKSNICRHYFIRCFMCDTDARWAAGGNEHQSMLRVLHKGKKTKRNTFADRNSRHVKILLDSVVLNESQRLFIDDMLDRFSTVHNPCLKHSMLTLLTYSTTRMNSGA